MLWKYVSKIWNKTILETCTKLIKTMSERIKNVIKAKGDYLMVKNILINFLLVLI